MEKLKKNIEYLNKEKKRLTLENRELEKASRKVSSIVEESNKKLDNVKTSIKTESEKQRKLSLENIDIKKEIADKKLSFEKERKEIHDKIEI